MSADLVTDFKCLAGIYEEQPDSSFALVTRMADLTEIFHPLQDGSTKVAPTGFLVKMNDGTIKDLNEVFEPLSSGKQCELPTNFEVDGTDLRDIFAGLHTVQVQLELSQLPAGVFDCTTRVKIHYDKSGSMNTAFGYITPAINVLKDWFSKTFNFGQAGYGSIVVEDPANPWEQTLTWISEDAGAASSQTEVHIAYINESMSGGTGSADGYVDKWIAAQQAGGHRYAAIMGCPPLYGGYDTVILGDITRDQKNGRTLAEMGVSAFFDIQQTAPSSSHIEIISNWLNVPTKPEDLTITVSALESDQYDDRVRWNVSSGICGLTQKANGAGILQSQSSWKHEVYVGDSQDLIHTENFTSLQTSYTYMADGHSGETDFYLKVTAVGDNGETDKSSSPVLCNKQRKGMLLTSASGYVGWTDLGWNFTRDLQGAPDDLGASYVYEVSRSDGSSFGSGVVQTVTESAFVSTKMFSGLDQYTTYYCRVRAINGTEGESNISNNHTDPCSNFSATRTDDGDSTATIEVQTQVPNTRVCIIEELEPDSIRGLVRPVADDQFDKLCVASGEGIPQTPTTTASGKLVFDGGFPKFWNWQSKYADDMFAIDTPGQWPYLVNIIKYCSSNRANKTNKVLYINDDGNGTSSYPYGKFSHGFKACAEYLGMTLTGLRNTESNHKQFLTNNDSAFTWKTYLDDFDMVIMVGANSMEYYDLSDGFLTGLLDYFDGGGGLFIVTDHNVFQHQVNQIVKYFGVQFHDNIDRTTGHNDYKVSTILGNTEYIPQGQHPLFVDMLPDSLIYMGQSEGAVKYIDDLGRTSCYTSGSDGKLTITTHNDGNAVGHGKIIVRTSNDCGKIFEAFPPPPSRRVKIFTTPQTPFDEITEAFETNTTDYFSTPPTQLPTISTRRNLGSPSRSRDLGYRGRNESGMFNGSTVDYSGERVCVQQTSRNNIEMGTLYIPLDKTTGDVTTLDKWTLDRGTDHGSTSAPTNVDYFKLTARLTISRANDAKFYEPAYRWSNSTCKKMMIFNGDDHKKRSQNSPYGSFGLKHGDIDGNGVYFCMPFSRTYGSGLTGNKYWAELKTIDSDWEFRLSFDRITGNFDHTRATLPADQLDSRGYLTNQYTGEHRILKDNYNALRTRLVTLINEGWYSNSDNMTRHDIRSHEDINDQNLSDYYLESILRGGRLGQPEVNVGVCMQTGGGKVKPTASERFNSTLRWRLTNENGYEIKPGPSAFTTNSILASHAATCDGFDTTNLSIRSREKTFTSATDKQLCWTTGTGDGTSLQNMNFYIYDNSFTIEFPSQNTGNDSDKWDGTKLKYPIGAYAGYTPQYWTFAIPVAGFCDAALHALGIQEED